MKDYRVDFEGYIFATHSVTVEAGSLREAKMEAQVSAMSCSQHPQEWDIDPFKESYVQNVEVVSVKEE